MTGTLVASAETNHDKRASMKRALLLAIGIASGLAWASSACAYNIFNKTTDTMNTGSIEVWGEHCIRCFHGHVRIGEHKSCPGDDAGCGSREISACIFSDGGYDGNIYMLRKCSVKVPAHGWVEFVDRNPSGYSRDGYVGCVVYDRQGNKLNDGWMPQGDGYDSCMAGR